MIGGERADVQRRFWGLSGVPKEESTNLDGTFVLIDRPVGTVEVVFNLHDSQPSRHGEEPSYYPLGALPSGSVLVLTQAAIRKFIDSLAPRDAGETQTAGTGTTAQQGHWPWGDHHTRSLAHLEAVAQRYWANFDPTDNSTAPTNEAVSQWLQERSVSKRMADAMASILRADDLPTGPRT